ncbi:MAG TPA: flagellar motor protein MotB [Desulfonauticus sp.]|jgi:chemotaxis protein MotB|nr:MAG: OmpA/MotB domain protein [Desulfonauticus sp. 38_4375]MDK2922237.1 chemotaxis protein MotB [Desulfonauticus sp.]HCO11966.1 flagellar motor protein MotB [Desulfonauticus sp.]
MLEDDFLQIEEEKEEEATWLVTFADLTMLLLVFFILLFSMSNLNQETFKETLFSVKQALGQAKKGILSVTLGQEGPGVSVTEIKRYREMIEGQKKVFSDLQYFYTEKGLEGLVGAYLESGKIILRLPAEVLFESGQVELTPAGKKALQELKDFFIMHPDQKINIIGYTDDTPPRPGGRFKDNWEISALRAINVLRYLLSLGIEPERLTATGFADLNPLYPNNSPDNRARNRRVEFVLEKIITP